MRRIYHHYEKWEDFKAGFYNSISIKNKNQLIEKVIELFSNQNLTEFYMNEVILKWKYSCEQNLSNLNMNRIAYLGQAASCMYCGSSCYLTMNAWNLLDIDNQKKADNIALKIIKIWEKKNRLKLTLEYGRKKDIMLEYQTKLLLN